MKYLAYAMKIAIVLIGLSMMYNFPAIDKPPFVSGLALVLIGLYLQCFVRVCRPDCCDAPKKAKKDKKKKKDKKHKKSKYDGNY